MSKYIAYADGGCRPKNNRCENSFGFYGFIIIDEDGNEVYKKQGKLGNYSTNNIAEFNSLLELVKYINSNLSKSIVEVYMDSLLTVNVANNKWNLKDKHLIEINRKIQQRLTSNIKIEWIPRENNLADALTR